MSDSSIPLSAAAKVEMVMQMLGVPYRDEETGEMIYPPRLISEEKARELLGFPPKGEESP